MMKVVQTAVISQAFQPRDAGQDTRVVLLPLDGSKETVFTFPGDVYFTHVTAAPLEPPIVTDVTAALLGSPIVTDATDVTDVTAALVEPAERQTAWTLTGQSPHVVDAPPRASRQHSTRDRQRVTVNT